MDTVRAIVAAAGIVVILFGFVFAAEGLVTYASTGGGNACQLPNPPPSCATQTSTTTTSGTTTTTTTPPTFQVSITSSSSTLPVGSAFTFSANIPSSVSGSSVSWLFGDGATSVGATVSHAYATAGTYTVTANAIGSSGQGTASTSVTVVPGLNPPGQYTLLVTVTSSYSGSAVQGATVAVSGVSTSAPVSTAQSGQASFTLSPGGYSVTVSASSYNTQTVPVTITSTNQQINVALTYSCGRQVCPQSFFGFLTGGLLIPGLSEAGLGIVMIFGGIGLIAVAKEGNP